MTFKVLGPIDCFSRNKAAYDENFQGSAFDSES
jgi:hypothetical protein